MNNTFQILTGFLDRYDDEVQGRELAEPGDDLKVKLQQLAQGNLRGSDQAELMGLLNRQPQWIGVLAAQVKALRNDPVD
jgi:hypothetical protein